MKTKSALFLSAALTAFVLVIVASVLMAYNTAKTNDTAAAANTVQQATATDVPAQANPTSAATATTLSGPEQAAALAVQYLNRTDVYSVEGTTLNGANVYKVVFGTGDIAYIGLDGKLISTVAAALPTAVSTQPPLQPVFPTPAPRHRSSGGGGGGEHEGNDG